MKLNVYLLREDVRTPESAILEKNRGAKYRLATCKAGLPEGITAWFQDPKPRPPRWAAFLDEGFDLPTSMKNQSNGFVLVVEEAGRLFAVTFGYGLNALDSGALVADFGLRIVLNVTVGGKLTTLDTRRLDRVTKQTRVHLNSAQELGEFGILPSIDWLRSARGTISEGLYKGRVSGTDSVQITFAGKLVDIKMACRDLLERYERTDYRKQFSFLDHLRPLRAKDPLVRHLNTEVAALVKKRDTVDLNLAQPEVPETSLHKYKLLYKGLSREVDDLDLAGVFSFLDDHVSDSEAIHEVRVVGLDDQDEARTKQLRLWQYLVAHIEHAGALYVLSLGSWYKTDKSYVDQLRNEARGMADLTETLALPPWKSGGEGEYNALVAQTKKWHLVDRKLVPVPGQAGARIECADIISQDGHFIHVKSLTKSATMSHLFSQARVASLLYRSEDGYAAHIRELTRQHFGEVVEQQTVVLGVGTSKSGPLVESLFFFTLVNLGVLAREFKAMNVPLALCRIEGIGK